MGTFDELLKRAQEAPPPELKIVREDEVTQGIEVAGEPDTSADEDPVVAASEESFPASDPPAYTGRRPDAVDPGDAPKNSGSKPGAESAPD